MKKALVFIFALLCALTSYAQQFRLVGNLTGFATVVDDSTYNVSLSFPSDLTGNSFLPTQIADDGSYRIFFQTGRIYTVTGVANATFSDADLTLVEYGSTDGSPTGQALVFDPQGRESVPQAPIAASGASGVLNAAIVSYNLPFQQGFGDGDGNDLVLSPGIDLESTTYTDAQALFTAVVASLNTKVDTLYERSDSLFYQVGGVETLFAVDTGGGGSLVDGDYGDVTVSGSGTVITINGQAVTFAKFQDIPENTFVGRDEAGTGSAETLTPAEARTLLNVEDGATADQTATDVPITDAGAYYTGTNVEAALQEVADTLTELRTDLSAIAAGAADGVATAGAYDGPNEEIDVTVAAPGANFSIDVSSLASDSELGDSTAQVRSEIPTTASDLPIADAGGYYTTSDVEAALQEEAVNRVALDQLVGDLIVLSGVPITSQDLGTFTGTTITDDNTVKGALQELETAVESAGGGSSNITFNPNYNGGQAVYLVDGTPTGDTIADILSGVLIPVADNQKLSDTIFSPVGWTLDVPFDMWRGGDGEIHTIYDDLKVWRDSFFHVTDGTYYVDPIGGSNFNSGTSRATAYQDYSFAIGRPGVKTIYLRPGFYDSNADYNVSGDTIQLVCTDGIAYMCNIEDGLTWTQTSISGVWKTNTADQSLTILDPNKYGELIDHVHYDLATDTSLMANNPATYIYVADSLYVHTVDGQEPVNFSNIIVTDNTAGNFTEAHTYLENIVLYGNTSYSSSGGLYWRNGGIFHNPTSVDLLALTGPAYLYGLKYGYSYNDAIDWKTNGDGYEINCIGRYAGTNTSGADNQLSTLHGGARVLTINPDYRGASNQVIFDVNANTQRWVLGGTLSGTYNKEGTSTSIIGVGNNTADFATMWIEGTKLGGDQDYDISANYGTVYIRNVNFNSTTRVLLENGGAIKKY